MHFLYSPKFSNLVYSAGTELSLSLSPVQSADLSSIKSFYSSYDMKVMSQKKIGISYVKSHEELQLS